MKRIRLVIGMLVMTVLFGLCSPTEMQAATSYTDPKTFFETCARTDSHAEFTDNYIYFCTKGKTAASTSQMRFYTLGFQITATGNGSSMYIDVKRGGNYLQQVGDEKAYSDGFTYVLYRIKYDDICKVMGNKNSTTWNNINKATWVTFQMDAIMTYKSSGSNTPACSITAESSSGALTFSNSKRWYTNNSAQLKELEEMFSVGRFDNYKGIQQPLRNNTMTVNFYARYTDVTSSTGYKIDPTTSQITKSNGTAFQRTGNRFGTVVLPNSTGNTGLGLKRTDIDFENKTIHIQRTLHYAKVEENDTCHFFFTTPKTETSDRIIPLLPETEAIFRRVKKKQLRNRMLNASFWKENGEFENMVFTSQDGAPVRYGDVNRTIKKVILRVNVQEEELAKLEG